jgi:hypothetical protein
MTAAERWSPTPPPRNDHAGAREDRAQSRRPPSPSGSPTKPPPRGKLLSDRRGPAKDRFRGGERVRPPLRPHDPLDDVDSSSRERPSRSHSRPGALRIEQVCRDRIATYKRPRPVDLRARGCGRGGRDRRPRPSVGNHAGGLLGVNTRGKCDRAPAGTPEPLARTRLPPTARRRAGPRCWSGSTRSA